MISRGLTVATAMSRTLALSVAMTAALLAASFAWAVAPREERHYDARGVRDPFTAPGSSEITAIVKLNDGIWAIVRSPDLSERIVEVGDTLAEGIVEEVDLRGLTLKRESGEQIRKPLPELVP
jgi:hypothetical protein